MTERFTLAAAAGPAKHVGDFRVSKIPARIAANLSRSKGDSMGLLRRTNYAIYAGENLKAPLTLVAIVPFNDNRLVPPAEHTVHVLVGDLHTGHDLITFVAQRDGRTDFPSNREITADDLPSEEVTWRTARGIKRVCELCRFNDESAQFDGLRSVK
jgi:hypothetical protein